MGKYVVRSKVVPGKAPPRSVDFLAVHNLKSDGVRGVRKLVKELRLELANVEFWYCKISEEQWALILNALSGVRTNLLSAERKAADAFLAELKREFGDVGADQQTREEQVAREQAEAQIKLKSAPNGGVCICPDDPNYKTELDHWQESEAEEDPDDGKVPETLPVKLIRFHCCQLSRKACVQLMVVLKNARELEHFTAVENGLDEIDCGLLVRALIGFGSLRELAITDNGFSNASAMLLAQNVAASDSLAIETINLSRNLIRSGGAIALGNMLRTPTELTTLVLTGNMLADEGAHAIAKGIVHNATLTALDLTECGIEHGGVVAIFQALEGNISLAELTMDRNSLDESLTTALYSLLENNRGLRRLGLAEMGHGLRSVSPIMDNGILKKNTTLRDFSLAGNRLGDRGGVEFAALFTEPGCSLEKLNLSGNRLGVTSGWALAEALKKGHHHLTSIDLVDNDFGADALAVMKHLQGQVGEVLYNVIKPSKEYVASDGYGGCCGCDMKESALSTDDPALGLVCGVIDPDDPDGCGDPRCRYRKSKNPFNLMKYE